MWITSQQRPTDREGGADADDQVDRVTTLLADCSSSLNAVSPASTTGGRTQDAAIHLQPQLRRVRPDEGRLGAGLIRFARASTRPRFQRSWSAAPPSARYSERGRAEGPKVKSARQYPSRTYVPRREVDNAQVTVCDRWARGECARTRHQHRRSSFRARLEHDVLRVPNDDKDVDQGWDGESGEMLGRWTGRISWNSVGPRGRQVTPDPRGRRVPLDRRVR